MNFSTLVLNTWKNVWMGEREGAIGEKEKEIKWRREVKRKRKRENINVLLI